jgi:hypothetical protein
MIGSVASEVDAAITYGIKQKQKQSKKAMIPIFLFIIHVPPFSSVACFSAALCTLQANE